MMLLVALGLLAGAGVYWWKARRPEPVAVRLPQTFTVGANGLPTISAALAQARDRDTIYVGIGEYREQLTLKSGVAMIARPPREAILRAPALNTGPAIIADHVEFARLSGFKIEANAEMPLSAGIVLTDSSVEIDDMEIAGAEVGIVIRGGGRSTLRGNAIHDCTGAPGHAAMIEGAGDERPDAGGGGWPWVLSDLKSLLETGTAFSRAG